jgi:hypothetical protein
LQRLEVLIAVMLARERCALADAAAAGCTALAAALATLPSGSLEMVANALAALGVECDGERPSGATRTATAESKLKTGADVPVTPPMLAVGSPNIEPFELLRPERVVAENYVDQQASTSCMLVAVGLPAPASSPASGAAPTRERVPMRITAPDGRVSPSSDPL